MILASPNLLPSLLIGLGINGINGIANNKSHPKFNAALLLWLAFMLSALISSIGSAAPLITITEWSRIAGMAACGYFAVTWAIQSNNIDWKNLSSNFKNGWLITICLFAAEFISDGKLSGSLINTDLNFFNKGACSIAVGLWLCLFSIEFGSAFIKGRRWAALVYLATTFLICNMESEAAIVGLIASTTIFLITRLYPSFYKPLAALFAAGLLTLPIIIYFYTFNHIEAIPYELKHSWDHRIYIAFNTIFLYLEKPLLGWGFGMSKGLHSMQQGYIVMAEVGSAPHAIFNYHPHNSSLQVLLETGLMGLILYSAAWAATIFFIGKSNKISAALKPYIYATYCCYIAISQLNFSAWASWWISLALLHAIAAASLNRSHPES